jgi:uncharacterized phage protein (TIGR02218 family)
MSFSLYEIASFLGRPVCLYEFAWGGQVWRYTSADRDLEYPDASGTMWTAIPISDNGFTQGAQQEPFVVTLPRSLEMCQLFKGTPPSTSIAMIARRFHKDDAANEAIVYWVGTVGSVKGIDAVKAEVTGLSISQTIRRTGNRLGWEVNCPHALFDAGCKLPKGLWRHDTTLTGIAGVDITVADLLPGLTGVNYSGGFIEWDATGFDSVDRRPIDTAVSGTTFTLLGRADRLTIGQAISIYPGCDLSAEMCNGTFNNLPNHGGFKFMAKKSPFDGNPIY